jgi:hypothetical protein
MNKSVDTNQSNQMVNNLFNSLIDHENYENEFLMSYNKCRTCQKLKKTNDFPFIKKLNNNNDFMRYFIHKECFNCYHNHKKRKIMNDLKEKL